MPDGDLKFKLNQFSQILFCNTFECKPHEITIFLGSQLYGQIQGSQSKDGRIAFQDSRGKFLTVTAVCRVTYVN